MGQFFPLLRGSFYSVTNKDVQKLDAYANQLLVESLLTSGTVHAVVSEELEHPVFAPPSQAGEYLVYLDPIDGSSNIDTNCPIGTIFSLYQKEGGFLQQGNRQVASGYVMYGPSVLFVYTSGHGVQGFTLDLSRGCFVYSHPNIMIPVKGNIYSINEAYEPLYDASTRAYLAQVRASAAHTARYVGSLVADAHRTLLKGGHFSLSAHSEPAGRKAAPDARSQPLCLAGGPSRGQGPEQSRQEPTDHSTKDGG